MKKILISTFIFLSSINLSFAEIDMKPLNVEKETLDLESKESSGQYKGKLKKKRQRDEFRLIDARFYGGGGLKYSFMSDTKMTKANKTNAQIQAETGQTSTIYYDENKLSLGGNGGYFASLGLYWGNGLRIETEYTQTTYDTKKLGDFSFTVGTDKIWEYLHGSSVNVNSVPITQLEFDVKTVMLNVIFEPFRYHSKITPYIGAGAGLVMGDVQSLKNKGSAKAFGAQAMVGLSHKFGNSGCIYLGYRFTKSGDLEQTFKRIVQVGASPTYTPYTIDSKETYQYEAHGVDLGFRLFF